MGSHGVLATRRDFWDLRAAARCGLIPGCGHGPTLPHQFQYRRAWEPAGLVLGATVRWGLRSTQGMQEGVYVHVAMLGEYRTYVSMAAGHRPLSGVAPTGPSASSSQGECGASSYHRGPAGPLVRA